MRKLVLGSVTCLAFSSTIAQFGHSQSVHKTDLDLPGKEVLPLAQQSSGSQKNDDSSAMKQLLSRRISLKLDKVSVSRAIQLAADAANVRVLFNDQHIAPYKSPVTLNASDMPLAEAFARILSGTDLYVAPSTPTTLVVRQRTTEQAPGKDSGQIRQAGVITGRVVDSVTGNGISGATVVIVGSQRAVSTSESGAFRFENIPVGRHSLSVRLLGYESQIIAIDVKPNEVASNTVVLRRTSTTLTEVVTTATGSQRRVEISNDVVTIDAEKLMQDAPVRNVTDLLVAAQVPGLSITPSSGEPGAPSRLRINGLGSISQNNDPVVIIDGVWVKSAFSTQDINRKIPTSSGNAQGKYVSSRLDALDPSTIESIEIVRGPAAATLYGPDAANGVIKITTKRGTAGPARWDLSFSRDWSKPVGGMPAEWVGYGINRSTSLYERCNAYDIRYGSCVQDTLFAMYPSSSFLTNEGAGHINRFSAGVSGGSQQIMYRLNVSVADQLGVRKMPLVDQTRFRLLNIPLDGSFIRPSNKRDRTVGASIIMSPRDGLDLTINFDGSQTNSQENNGVLRAINSWGALAELDRNDTISLLYTGSNAILERRSESTTRGLVSLMANWNPVHWWSGNITLGMDREYRGESGDRVDNDCVSGLCQITSNIKSSASGKSSVYTVRGQASFFPSLGWASRFLTIRPGVSADLRRAISSSEVFSVQSPAPANTNGLQGTITEPSVQALAGIGANVYIRLFDRISFDPALRRDFGGSRTLRNNAKTYPRFGTSWLVSDESFFPKSSWIGSLRLRAAMGFAAVQPDLSAVYGEYNSNKYTENGKEYIYYSFASPGNPLLEPERSFEVETGFDADMFYDRVQLTVTHSSKRNTNTLVDREIPPSIGGGFSGTRQENIAKVLNRLTTAQISALVMERDELSLRLGMNFAIHDNQIRSLGPGVSPFGKTSQRYVAGYPVGGLWYRPILGVHDANGNGLLDAGEYVMGDTFVYAGTNMPRFTSGYNVEVSVYRDFRFTAFMDYKGSFVQNRNANQLWVTSRPFWDISAPIEEQVRNEIASHAGGDFQDVSELRLQSATLTWNVPPHLVSRLKGRLVQVSLSGSNLGLWTKYRGRDPSVNATPVGEQTTDNHLVIPMPRSFSLQFRVGY